MSEMVLRPGASWVTPYIIVKDVDQAADFYEKAFQFKKLELAPGEDGTSWHGELQYRGQMLMLGKEGAYGGTTRTPKNSGLESPMNLYLYCDNVDDFYQKALEQGAVSLGAPEDMFWGDRMCRLQDPDGYVWCFGTPL